MNKIKRRGALTILVSLLAIIAVTASACEPAPVWPEEEVAVVNGELATVPYEDTGIAVDAAEAIRETNVAVRTDAEPLTCPVGEECVDGVQPGEMTTQTIWTSKWVHNCGWVTCTIYFTIRTTRFINRYGWAAAIAWGVIKNAWVGAALAAVGGLVTFMAHEAIAAAPDRCLTIKHVGYFPPIIVGVGHVHHTNHYCRSGY
jgi:hypothetical protein